MTIQRMGHQVIGYPDLDTNRQMLKRLELHGFERVELQLPFSEPVADGPLFQKANQEALMRGMTIEAGINFIEEQVKTLSIPVYVMSYFNPLVAYGIEAFVHKMSSIGVKGLIIPDAPHDQCEAFWSLCKAENLEMIPIATLNTQEDRMAEMCATGSGFLYFVPRLGVTGTKSKMDQALLDQLDSVRNKISLPLAVGFGLEEKEDLDTLKGHCDIAIFGSVLLKTLENKGLEGVDSLLSELSNYLTTLYQKVIQGKALSQKEAAYLMEAILLKSLSEVKISAILSHYSKVLPSLDELSGFIQTIKKAQPQRVIPEFEVLDNCGTGGDARGSFNISTTAAFVAAEAGVKVAKHGNRAMSSQCGAIDLLEVLGIPCEANNRALNFYFAQDCHPLLKEVASVRRQLGFKTIFNILGPLLSPVEATYQLIGVYDESIMPLMAAWLAKDPKKHALLVHGQDGLDELSISGPSTVYEIKKGQITKKSLSPETVGLNTFPIEGVAGGSPEENGKLLVKILKGEGSPAQSQIVQFNAGAAIYLYGIRETLEDAVELAGEILKNGRAYDLLCQLQKGGDPHVGSEKSC